jgi:hypothetical protein
LLFIRSVVATKSILILILHDAVDDAAIILRTIFEIEFQLGAIKSDREIAVRLIQASEAGRLKRLKRFFDSGRPLPEGMTEEEINRQLEQAKETGKELQKIFLAKAANLENEYRIFYSALSDAAHVSPVGLRHYLEEGDAPGSYRTNSSRSLFSPELVMALAGATELETLKIVKQIRGDAGDEKLEALALENGQIIDAVRQQAFQTGT